MGRRPGRGPRRLPPSCTLQGERGWASADVRVATEDAPFAPSNPYEFSKVAAEQVAHEFAGRGLPVVIARPGFVYGPGDRHVLRLFQAIASGRFFYVASGRYLCQPTFVADVVSGVLWCLLRGRAYHITGSDIITFREVGETIATAMGVRPPSISIPLWPAKLGARACETLAGVAGSVPPLTRNAVAFFSRHAVFSAQKARRELGYCPQYDLETGVFEVVAWYRQSRDGCKA